MKKSFDLRLKTAKPCFNCGHCDKCPRTLETPENCRNYAPLLSQTEFIALAGFSRKYAARAAKKHSVDELILLARTVSGAIIKTRSSAIWLENYHSLRGNKR